MGTTAVGLAERVRLGLEADLSARRGYAVTLMRAGNTLHGWRFPAEVLRAAVPRFEGASCFVDHVGWFQQAASLGDLVGVISEVEWSEAEGGLTGRLRLSNTPAGDWMEALTDQIIEDREKGLPVPNVGLSADMLAGYYVEGETRVATEIRSVYSVDAVFASLARGRSSWHATPHPVLTSPGKPLPHEQFGAVGADYSLMVYSSLTCRSETQRREETSR